MTHENLISIGGGVLLSMAAKTAGWLGDWSMVSHSVEVFAWGILGGTGGWCGRVMVTSAVEKLKLRRINKDKNKNKNNNQQ